MKPQTHLHCCAEMEAHLSGDKLPLCYVPKFREYGIRYNTASSFQLLHYCPWCGVKLPISLRDRYFDELDALGMDPDDPNLPERYKSDAWYKEKEE